MLDDTQNQNQLCSYTYDFDATYPMLGPGQGAAPNGDVGGMGSFDSWAALGTVFADPSNTYEPS